MKKFGIHCQLRIKLFFIVICRFSLVKARWICTPRLCKLRKDCLTGTGHCAMVLTKYLHFLIFQFAKGGTKTQRGVAEGWSFQSFDKCIYDCKLPNEKEI